MNPVLFFGEELADHAAVGRNGRHTHVGSGAFLPILAQLDAHGTESRTDGLLECLVFFSCRQRVASRQGDDNQRLRDVRQLFVVTILGQRDTAMNQILMPPLQIVHTGFDLRFPTRSHRNIATFNFQFQGASM